MQFSSKVTIWFKLSLFQVEGHGSLVSSINNIAGPLYTQGRQEGIALDKTVYGLPTRVYIYVSYIGIAHVFLYFAFTGTDACVGTLYRQFSLVNKNQLFFFFLYISTFFKNKSTYNTFIVTCYMYWY
jgi:hypothetical protein